MAFRHRFDRRNAILGTFVAAGAALMTRTGFAGQWSGKRVLVAYHTRTGHTRTVAEVILGLTGGDAFEIEPATPYPDDYDQLVAQNVEEQRSGFLPPLRRHVEQIADYDVVFLGSPLWNVRLTPPVRSFLSAHELSRCAIAPFTTYIVSGLGRSRDDIAETAPGATILEGLAVLGEAGEADGAVANWLNKLDNSQGDDDANQNTRP